MLILKTLQRATGTLKAKIENIWRKEGDLGKVAEILIKEKEIASFSTAIGSQVSVGKSGG